MRFLGFVAIVLFMEAICLAQDPIPPVPGKVVENQFVVEMKVVEKMRGIPKGSPALSATAVDLDRINAQNATNDERFAESSDKLWRAVDDHPSVYTLAQPKLAVLANQQAVISLVSPRELPYLVRENADTFKLMRTEPKELGVEIKLTLSPVKGEADQIEIAPLEFSVTTLDRREKIDGLDLDVGKPVVSTRKLQTSATMKLGKVYETIIPSPPQKVALLLMRVERIEQFKTGTNEIDLRRR
jgi:hypothetical protein